MAPVEVIERTSVLGRVKNTSVINNGEVKEFEAWGGNVTVKGLLEGGYVVHDWAINKDTYLLKDGNYSNFNPRFLHPPTILIGRGQRKAKRKIKSNNNVGELLPNGI